MFDLFKDGSFEIAKTKNYIPSIQVCLDGFSFFIFDSNEKKIVAIKNSPLKISSEDLLARRLKEWLETEELLKNQFKTVRIYYYTENFTFVPSEYVGHEKNRNLTTLLFDKKPGANFIENKIEDLNLSLFYPVSQDVLSVLNQFFNKGYEINHPIKNLIPPPVISVKRYLSIIHTTKKYFYLLIFENSKLLLANCFLTPHQNDLVYNVINSFQQLGIPRSNTELFVSGAIHQDSEINELLKAYFDNLSFLKPEVIIANDSSDASFD